MARAARSVGVTLPPGQRAVDGFPRFGTHLHRPPPPVPADPKIDIAGAVRAPWSVAVSELATMPRHQMIADLHCVAGWSATGLQWEGVPFATFYRSVIEPRVKPDAPVSHVGFRGLDGYRSIVTLTDALGDDVLVADRLGGLPIDGDHGAPVRLVSPSQYGFVSTKHLCAIEVYTTDPAARYHPSPLMQLGLQLVKPHPRARVWHEERHRYLPAWLLRPVYRSLIAPIRRLGARGRT
jgi:DMSO/TMAO reductase YedYZ molybdopterin-dependent catalytic subunit